MSVGPTRCLAASRRRRRRAHPGRRFARARQRPHARRAQRAARGSCRAAPASSPWVDHMIGMRAELRPEEDDEAIERAVSELDAFGTVAVGEVTNTLAAVGALARRGIVGSVLHEVFGVEREALERRVAALPSVVEERVGTWPTRRARIRPHAAHALHHACRCRPPTRSRRARKGASRKSSSGRARRGATLPREWRWSDCGLVRIAPQAAARSAAMAGDVTHPVGRYPRRARSSRDERSPDRRAPSRARL